MCIAAAIVGAGALTAGAGVIGAGDAASAQENAANTASQTQLQMYDQTVAREQPFVDAGGNALKQLMAQLGSLNAPFDASKLDQTPGYQFARDQGLAALANKASATGGIGGGNQLKALMQYGTGLADQTYNSELQNYEQQQQRVFGNLQTIAGSGQNAAANLGALGTQVGTNIGNNITGAGNAAGASIIAGTNAITGGIQGASNNYLLSQLLGGGGGGYLPGGGSGGTGFNFGVDNYNFGMGG